MGIRTAVTPIRSAAPRAPALLLTLLLWTLTALLAPGRAAAEPPEDPLTPHPCGLCGAGHVVTPDRLAFDLAVTGDYVLTRSASDVLVQARQERHPDSETATITTDAALRVGDDLLLFSARQAPALVLNGAGTDLPTEDGPLPGGGAIQVLPSTVGVDDLLVIWPDGSTVARLRLTHGEYLEVGVERHVGTRRYLGLLGNLDGDPANDLQSPTTGLLLRPVTDADLLRFTEAWRVDTAESLFSDPAPERETVVIADTILSKVAPSDRHNAETICSDAGVVDALALTRCIQDVAGTDRESFAGSARAYQDAVLNLPVGAHQVLYAHALPGEDEPLPSAEPAPAPPPARPDPTTTSSPAPATPTEIREGSASGTGAPLSGVPILWTVLAALLVLFVVAWVATTRGTSTRPPVVPITLADPSGGAEPEDENPPTS